MTTNQRTNMTYRGDHWFSIAMVMAGILVLQGCVMVTSAPLSTSNNIAGASATYSLPKTVLNVKRATPDSDIVITAQTIADPQHTYALFYDKNPFAEDDLTIEVDTKTGLMKAVNATASDKTTEILEEIGKTAGRLVGLQSGVPMNFLSASDGIDKGQKAKVANEPFDITFDPAVASERVFAAAYLRSKAGSGIQDIRCANCPNNNTEVLEGSVEGILVRPARWIRIDFCKSQCTDSNVALTQWVKSYSSSPLVSIPVERAVAVSRKTTLTFSDGEVSKIIHNKPSEVAGVVAIPGKIISAIFAGLVQSETDKKGLIEASTQSMEAQSKLIDSQVKLIEAQTKLEKQRETPALTGTPATGDRLP